MAFSMLPKPAKMDSKPLRGVFEFEKFNELAPHILSLTDNFKAIMQHVANH